MKISPHFLAALFLASSVQAAPTSAPDLDLAILHYTKVVTPEGETREGRYQEKMMRRPGHVWLARVLPKNPAQLQEHEAKHKHFNHVVLPRHVQMEHGKLRLEYIDVHDKDVVAIPVSEYDNVNFDGSWEKAYYLLDPKLVKAMPLSTQKSPVPGAVWRERQEKGWFQRVLWDEQKQIPLVIENGDLAATVYRRVDIKPETGLSRDLPWQNVKGYAQKEYADFLD